jgi:hypothetical protein
MRQTYSIPHLTIALTIMKTNKLIDVTKGQDVNHGLYL